MRPQAGRVKRRFRTERTSWHDPPGSIGGVKPDPLVISWQGCQLRVRHDDPRLRLYSPQASRLRSAVELASDVEGLRLVLASVLEDRYRVRVEDDVIGLWRRR